MKKWGIIFAILVLVVAVFLFARKETPREVYDSPAPPDIFVENPLIIEKVFSEGSHTLEGIIHVPTPCHELSLETLILESFPEQVVLQFSIESKEACIQVVTEKTFIETVEVSPEATFRASINGEQTEIEFRDPEETT